MAKKPTLHLSGNPEADRLLSADPLALLIGMVLDQQIRLEQAFAAPAILKERLGGTLDAAAIAAMDPGALAEVFSIRPALHRFPGSMAKRVHELCTVVTTDYDGDAANVWKSAQDGKQLFANIKALPGFGDQKARIFVALLGKQLGVNPPGWEDVSTPYSEPGSHRSVADIVDPHSMASVRDYKLAMKAKAKAASGASPAPAAKRRGASASR
jgi:uncharacterized HhH-GPD family protein